MDDAGEQLIAERTEAGMKPSNILEEYRKNFPDKHIDIRDINNKMTSIRKAFLDGLHPVAALFKLLASKGYSTR